jgi:hypothetical protein
VTECVNLEFDLKVKLKVKIEMNLAVILSHLYPHPSFLWNPLPASRIAYLRGGG